MMPPWPEIFSNDDERKHSFEDALSSYERLLRSYERFGYRIVLVPKLDICARADFVLNQLRESQSSRAIKAWLERSWIPASSWHLAGGRGRAAAWRCRKPPMYVLINGRSYGLRPVCGGGDAGLLRPREAQRVVHPGFRRLLWSRFSLRVSSRRLAVRLGRSHLGAGGPAPLELVQVSPGFRLKAAPPYAIIVQLPH
jgi:hypothetical protein